jgi:MFS family permease
MTSSSAVFLTVGIIAAGLFTCLWQLGPIFYHFKEHQQWPRLQSRLWELQGKFLVVFFLCSTANWLQVPYDLPLYEKYGLDHVDMGQLLVIGFLSSLVFASFGGFLADTYGRRLACEVYCVLTIFACFTRHFSSIGILLCGRVFQGIATSILNSAFEAWFVSELRSARSDAAEMNNALAHMHLGGAAAAVLSTALAASLSDIVKFRESNDSSAVLHSGGYCVPFDLAALIALAALALMAVLWKENSGALSREIGLSTSFRLVAEDPKMLSCGVVVALFEAAFFLVHFYYAGALKEGAEDNGIHDYYSYIDNPDAHDSFISWGIVYMILKVFLMAGIAVFGIGAGSLRDTRVLPEALLCGALLVSGAAVIVSLLPSSNSGVIASLIVFQLSSGIYWPAMAAVKSSVVTEGIRATVYSLYQVPLNFITFGVMLVSVSWRFAFACGAAASLLAFVVAAAQFKTSKKEAWQPACRSQQLELRDADQDAADAAQLLEAGELSGGKGGNESTGESFESAAPLLPTSRIEGSSWFQWGRIGEEATNAVTRVQAMARGKLARKELAAQTEMVTKLQAAQRGKAVRQRREQEAKAATKLQAVHRGRATRKRSARGWWPDEHPDYSPNGGNCPWGHPMDLQLAESGFCDKCGRTLELGELVFECDQCDFFICGDCQPPGAQRKPAAEATERLDSVVEAAEPAISTDPAIPSKKTCLKGHPLKSWVCDSTGECDGCGKTIENGETVMDCEPCDYMLCRSCFEGGSPAPQVQQASAAAKVPPPSSSLKCPLGHTLQEWTNNTTGECDVCGRNIPIGEAVLDCEPCDYYMCKMCIPKFSKT